VVKQANMIKIYMREDKLDDTEASLEASSKRNIRISRSFNVSYQKTRFML